MLLHFDSEDLRNIRMYTKYWRQHGPKCYGWMIARRDEECRRIEEIIDVVLKDMATLGTSNVTLAVLDDSK